MALSLGTESVSVTKEERTWRVELFCEKNTVPLLVAHRELISTDATGNIIAADRSAPDVTRSLTQIAVQNFTVGDQTYTGAELAAVIAAVVDILRTEDKATTPPVLPAPPPQA